VFKGKIFKRLKKVFEAYDLKEKDVDLINQLIHYKKEDVPKEKAFLYQVCYQTVAFKLIVATKQ
jgi:hypothetical protein